MADWSRLLNSTPSVGLRLASGLERMILSGELEKDSRLPPEREFAEQLNVSRASLRQALHDLELRGLVDRRPGRGTIVLDPDRAALSEPLLRKMSVEERTLAEVMDLRASIEPPLAARAAARATEADIDELRDLVAWMDRESDPATTVELDIRFHVKVARSTHNLLLARLMETASEWVGPSRADGMQSVERRAASNEAHRAIADAIAAHDPERAATAMAAHIAVVSRLIHGSSADDLDGR